MLVIQRPTVEALGEAEATVSGSPSARSSPASATPSATRCAARCCRRSRVRPSRTVRFDDALHEFDTITGVTEDVTDIILNLKDIVLTSVSDEPVIVRLDVRGPAEVTAGDIKVPSEIEILNQDLHIATLNAKGRLAIDLTVERGRGYLSADRETQSKTIGVIPIDAIFSPVRRVTFIGRAHPRRAVDQLRPPRARHRDRRLDHAAGGAGLGRRHAARRWSTWSPT